MTFEEKLRIAAADAAEYMASAIPDDSVAEHVFSDTFTNAIRNLIENWGRHKSHRVIKKVLIAVAVILLAFGLIMAASPKIRADVIGWIRGLFGIYITYEYEEEDSQGSDAEYKLGWIPEDYTLVKKHNKENGTTYVYSNTDGNSLIFAYLFGNSRSSLFVDPESADLKNVKVGKHVADLMIAKDSKESNTIIWINEDKNVLFEIVAYEEEATLIAMAESVTTN